MILKVTSKEITRCPRVMYPSIRDCVWYCSIFRYSIFHMILKHIPSFEFRDFGGYYVLKHVRSFEFWDCGGNILKHTSCRVIHANKHSRNVNQRGLSPRAISKRLGFKISNCSKLPPVRTIYKLQVRVPSFELLNSVKEICLVPFAS